ncbi:hypothetical protein BGW36DRAFT_458415 [Talaromyces proteolyticus]|uniref:Zn(2)-C6 fungal-type domain-containing protein n=1 Tax=Talaromyces proteolyticus TaxID=1131652 RepID=A0AAD4KXV7_9EURO|nr:uncharacterized protein BGW36DRAFT_458415 [Talaromyces proteolyticus]KAH8701537.1 hypothetical protein BGW36DRAFT_458415 [Talaromyces proteolyticus]
MEGPDSSPGRATASCERCKQRKSRCDRKQPACQRCRKLSVSCEYPSRKKPGFPAGHRLQLEEKIKKLEEELRTLRNDGCGVRSEIQSSFPSFPTHGPDTADTDSWTTSAPIYADHRSEALPDGETPDATSERTRQIQEKQPPTDLVVSLSSLFFRHIHPWFPFLDIRRLCLEMGNIDEPSLLHYALFGVSLPYSFDSRLDRKSSDSFWKYCKRRIALEVLEEPSYSSLEALTILVLDLSGMTNGPQVWGALAIATKLVQQLQNVGGRVWRTSATDSSGELIAKVDSIYQQRLFWAIYSLDCYITITTGRSSDLTDDRIKHFVAAKPLVWQKHSTSMETLDKIVLSPVYVSCYQLELLDLSRRLHNVHIMYAALGDDEESLFPWLEQFRKCSTELAEWACTLPSCLHLQNLKDPRRQVVMGAVASITMLHAYYHALVIHAHGLLAFPAYEVFQSAPFEDTREESQSRCLHSISIIIEIVSGSAVKLGDKLGWPFTWSIWVAARYLLIQESRGGNLQREKLTIILDFLRQAGSYWQISSKYYRLLRLGTSELQTGMMPGQRRGQSILQFLTDVRISTSDLEDQFRVDPILQNGTLTQKHAVSIGEDEQEYSQVSRFQDLQGDSSNGNYLNLLYQASDNWFHVPLYASSAYQQHLSY